MTPAALQALMFVLLPLTALGIALVFMYLFWRVLK
jgi:hypothetical protein